VVREEILCSFWRPIGKKFKIIYYRANPIFDCKYILTYDRAEDLDSAVFDRCDESLLFPLPDEDCRYHLIRRYFDYYVQQMQSQSMSKKNYLFDSIQNNLMGKRPQKIIKIVDDDVMDANQIRDTVNLTSGFSGREIGKLMIAMQGAIHSSDAGCLTRLRCQQIIDAKVEEHNEKMRMKNHLH